MNPLATDPDEQEESIVAAPTEDADEEVEVGSVDAEAKIPDEMPADEETGDAE